MHNNRVLGGHIRQPDAQSVGCSYLTLHTLPHICHTSRLNEAEDVMLAAKVVVNKQSNMREVRAGSPWESEFHLPAPSPQPTCTPLHPLCLPCLPFATAAHQLTQQDASYEVSCLLLHPSPQPACTRLRLSCLPCLPSSTAASQLTQQDETSCLLRLFLYSITLTILNILLPPNADCRLTVDAAR